MRRRSGRKCIEMAKWFESAREGTESAREGTESARGVFIDRLRKTFAGTKSELVIG